MTEATREANRLATVFGGSGFLGRYIVRALVHEGWRIRVAVRRPDLAAFLQPIGGVGQIQPVQANLRFPEFDCRGASRAQPRSSTPLALRRKAGRRPMRPCMSRAPPPWREPRGTRVFRPMCIFRELARTQTPPRPISQARGSARKRRGKRFPMRSSCVRRSCSAPRTASSTASAPLPAISLVLPLLGGGETRLQPVYVGDIGQAVAAALSGRGEARGRL